MVKFLHENPCQWPFDSHERSNYQPKKYFYNLAIGETDPPFLLPVYYDISALSIVKFSNLKARNITIHW